MNWQTIIVSSSLLMALAWILADHYTPARNAPEGNVGYNLLIAGAVPWLMQYGAIVILLSALFYMPFHFDRTHILCGILYPLIVGLC